MKSSSFVFFMRFHTFIEKEVSAQQIPFLYALLLRTWQMGCMSLQPVILMGATRKSHLPDSYDEEYLLI